MLGIVKF